MISIKNLVEAEEEKDRRVTRPENIANCKEIEMRLKSWESPRKQGRNKKGKAATARLRQLKKQNKQLKKKLSKKS
ncbi:MAG: hypothetical protein ACLFTJ_06195 [Halothece sp.]